MHRLLFLLLTLSVGRTFAAQLYRTADAWEFRDLSSPAITEDGSQIAYLEQFNEQKTARACANLRTIPAAGGVPRPSTEGPWLDSSPAWSPDAAAVAFLSDREGSTQIWIRHLDSTTDRRLTSLSTPPLTVAWSPDGKWLAFSARVPAARPAPAWAPASILPVLALRPGPVRLFVIPATGGAPRTLPLAGLDGELEVIGEPAWMPSGHALLVAAAPADAANPLEGSEIYSVDLASGAARRLTRHPGPDLSPVPSPDGSRIAWLARDAKPQSFVTTKLYTANPDGSRAKVLAGTLDRDPVRPQWSNDSRTVYFLAGDRGATHVYAARGDGSFRQVTSGAGERFEGFSLAANGRAVAIRRTAAASVELIAFPVDVAGKAVTLAAVNSGLLAARDAGAIEEIHFTSAGKTIQGWLTAPPGRDPAKKYPLLIDLDEPGSHMCGGEFRLRSQVFAARGFLVLCLNPRGTPGYGEEFGNLIRSDIPGAPFDDVMGAVDRLIALGRVDEARVSLIGGLVAAWALGHTGRFHAVVLREAAGWMEPMPGDDPGYVAQHSPLAFAAGFRTPTMIFDGGSASDAGAFYRALQAQKADPVLLHLGAASPAANVQGWDATIAWLER